MSDINSVKAAIRSDIRAKRKLISEDELVRCDAALLDAFKQALESDIRLNKAFSASEAVAVYKAVGGELPCDELASFIRSMGKKTVYPRIDGDNMVFCNIEKPDSELVKGDFGIPAPSADADSFPNEDIGIVIMPGIAFDKEGRRLGQGKGFYDRWTGAFRSGEKPLLVGVCMSFQMVPEVPHDTFDIPSDVLLCI